jgi:hypothetical protein
VSQLHAGIRITRWLARLPLIACCITDARADDHEVEVAQELSNPVAPLLGITLQGDLEWSHENFDHAERLQANVPFAIADDWNLISRSVWTLGLPDLSQSLFISPQTTRIPGLTWGVGPVVAYAGRLGLGATAAIIHTVGPVTYGVLVEQLWLAGGGAQSYLQPQIAWTFGSRGTSLRAVSESTYDWRATEWSAPVIAQLAQVVDAGDRSFELALGPIVYLATADDVARWGIRVSVTLVH